VALYGQLNLTGTISLRGQSQNFYGSNCWRHDTQHNDIKHNNIQHNNKLNTTLAVMPVLLYWQSFTLSVANKSFMLNVIMLSVVAP